MKFDHEPGGDERELMKLWQENLPPGALDPAQIVQEMAGRTKKFDRTIWWRNFREYAAGGLLLVFFAWRSFHAEFRLLAVAGIVAVGFVMTYLWLSHRQTIPLDPAASASEFRAALIEKYDRQIRLLSNAKYWYVLPLYSWMLLSIMTTVPSQDKRRRVVAVLVVTVFSILVVWLNEGFAAGKLKRKRNETEALFEKGKSEQ